MALPGLSIFSGVNRQSLAAGVTQLKHGSIGIPILLLMLLGMMTLPVPPFLLDVFFSFNIALSIVVLLVGVYALRPLDFAVFPTILLVATLLRLALNVASTRVVLLYGHEGGDAAGKVIEAFGEVVIGGNYAVGLVVFLILMIINFVVVTKGAGRISEVSARFTLDAMPGKQMAIDADLNAGLIDQEEAKIRRADVASEADFYGAMDGASKFVRGDAIAGILILIINVVGGLAVGMAQHQLEFQDALQKYILLTIGDGLVAQIPSLLLSTAAAILVTRVNSSEDMSRQVMRQMFDSPKALAVSACVLFVMGSIPGMPHLAFLGLGLIAGGLAWMIHRRRSQGELVADVPPGTKSADAKKAPVSAKTDQTPALEHQPAPVEVSWEDVKPVDVIGLEVGYRLIPMVDKSQGGELLGRIRGVRKKMSQEVGFLIPTVHIRDNLDLLPNQYRVTLMGVTVAEEEVHPDRDLAINPGQVFGDVDGIKTKDPAFGLPAIWIKTSERDHAQTLGYTVVDASTVVATHINQLLSQHVSELLGLEDVQKLVDLLAKTHPKLAEHLIPDSVTLKMLLKILQMLLAERVSIKDMRSIAEAIAANSEGSPGPVTLLTAVRQSLSRQIIQGLVGNAVDIPVITLDPALEQLLLKTYQQSQKSGDALGALEPGLAQKLRESVTQAAQKQEAAGNSAILLVATQLRYELSRFLRTFAPDLNVLGYNEIPNNKQITIVASVGAD
ncbi:flagellar biosynthesis protein FlhA [Simiduia agarivorans]|uniref:Flagellar biosynthesis protein FlhA n=1 Tax=Simiduia agarivorans (strain DSM 21679 / JCM 13881 / BCRC 17597 / SA1) TaxID=1117647 RepID=K4KIC1_SIMAS|nr:flagellar biosynthesis protein FlhA [Simiduia agarivorans]AFU97703.1 flagellar biosynthesis protein FlhA [Simiduia agarivorans SA1 = DSM 21679]